MERKRLFTIFGIIGAAALLVLAAVFPLVKNLLLSKGESKQLAAKISLCDKDASGMCLITFGASDPNEMTIILQLPNDAYPPFYVLAANKGVQTKYPCEAADSPRIILCTGLRTPLGEPLDISVYSTQGDLLIANGSFTVSSVAVAFSSNFSTSGFSLMGKAATPTPSPTPTVVQAVQNTPIPVTPTLTPTPDTAYPNP